MLFSVHAFTVRSEASALYSYTVKVDSGYLALRNAAAYDYTNEIGKLYSGSTIQVYDYNMTSTTYWWVYAPSLGKSGYVNNKYLINKTLISGGGGGGGVKMEVSVSSGYLALRNAKAFDYSNEIGKLYSGEIVEVLNTADSTYWWVFVPSTGQYGYVNKNYLNSISTSSGGKKTVKVSSGYLALRNAPAYDSSNEIGKLFTGDIVEVISTGGTYWWVYAPTLGKSGYVNSSYLFDISSGGGGGGGGSALGTYTVNVSSGYLALRNAKAYDSSNEIGKLYTGEQVTVYDKSDYQYWWVYSSKLGLYGYVNKDYLVAGSGGGGGGGGSYTTYTTYVSDGYLALRSAPAYDYSNEIAKLYNGTKVQVAASDMTSSSYWWVYVPSLGMSGYVNNSYLY